MAFECGPTDWLLYWGDVGPDAGGDGPRGPRGYDEVIKLERLAITDGLTSLARIERMRWSTLRPRNWRSPRSDASVNKTQSITRVPKSCRLRARDALLSAGGSDEFPAVGSGGRTACAGPVYYFDAQAKSENRFPAQYNATLFAFEWSRNAIYAVHLDEESNLKSVERFLPEMSFIRPIDLQFDAAGSLYVIEYGETWGVNKDAQLVRVDYVRGNRAPTAVAKATGNIGREPLTVSLSAEDLSTKTVTR